MPVIAPQLLDCALYLYPSEQAAKDGVSAGGSGFFVGIEAKIKGWWHLYAVTNKHVIDAGNHVLRVNTTDGAFDCILTEPGAWTVAIDDDLALLPVELGHRFHFNFIPTDIFLPQDTSGSAGVFTLEVGDDAVLIGRLVTHEGRQRNRPVARFGSIAMLADTTEPIRISPTQSQVAFLVDCRSLSGASGSAVLAFRVPHRDGMMIIGGQTPILLGIDCAHLPFWTRVCEQRDRATAMANMFVESNSGIAVVIPAWRILALLDAYDLKSARHREEQRIAAIVTANDEER